MVEGQYRCVYCGHLSLPPRPVVDQTQRAALLASVLSQFETRRAGALGAREELRKRAHDAMEAGRRTNAYVMLGIGGLFLLFALGCFGGAVAMSAGKTEAPRHHGHVAPPVSSPSSSPGGPLVFGLFWLVFGGTFVYIGQRYRRAGGRDKRMRESGLRGSATVKSYRETSLVLDGNRKFDLVLEVEVPGRAPFVVQQSDYVPHPSAVTTGANLPVFVDPANGEDVMVDWFTLGRG
jgi:hypothetical protein